MERKSFIKAITIRALAVHAHTTSAISIAGSGIKRVIDNLFNLVDKNGYRLIDKDGFVIKVEK